MTDEFTPIKAGEVDHFTATFKRTAKCRNCTWGYSPQTDFSYQESQVTNRVKQHVAQLGHIVDTERSEHGTYYAEGSPHYREAIKDNGGVAR